jgi:hypothetical protein
MIADSSSEGSIERNAAAISRNTSGARWNPSTRIMPGMLCTLNGWPTRGTITYLFRMPMFGSARKIHAIVWRIPGMISGTREAAKSRGLNGTSVRTVR